MGNKEIGHSSVYIKWRCDRGASLHFGCIFFFTKILRPISVHKKSKHSDFLVNWVHTHILNSTLISYGSAHTCLCLWNQQSRRKTLTPFPFASLHIYLSKKKNLEIITKEAKGMGNVFQCILNHIKKNNFDMVY